MASTTQGIAVLNQGVGYGIVVGVGVAFALLMIGITWLQNRYTTYSTHGSEEFNTASRSVKPGLIAAGIVSSWTWAATLLTSSTFAYSYGVIGPMGYATVGTWQIILFTLIAIKIKSNAPGAHTFPEIVLTRHGKIAHVTFLFYGLVTNLLTGACLVLGGSQVVAALTGMNVYAAIWLIPLVVGAYVIGGGLRSTFIADYVHTFILLISIFIFGLTIYTSNPVVGSPGKLYDLLIEASTKAPILGNHQGSYLSLRSNGGIVFAIDIFTAGFACVWLDQAYWQRAIASRPETTVKAYILGGIAWYGIPFGFATAMGLGCVAMQFDPSFPTYPNPLSAAQNGAGLSAPATAVALLGKGGAGLMLLLLFMAVTSSTSAEFIAVSSLLTFDIYKTYIKPHANGNQLVAISHLSIGIYGVVLAAFCCILNAVSINLTWIITVIGIIVGGAAIPVGLVLLWPRMSTIATIVTPWVGSALSITAWLVVSSKRGGSISVATTGDVTNAVAGCVTAIFSGPVCAVILTLIFPKIVPSTDPDLVTRRHEVDGTISESSGMATPPQPEQNTANISNVDKKKAPTTDVAQGSNEVVDFLIQNHIEHMDPLNVKRATRLAVGFNLLFFAVGVILVPFTLFGGGWVFPRRFFIGWVVVSMIWVWVTFIICVLWPLWESRGAIVAIFTSGLKPVNKASPEISAEDIR